MIDGPFSLQALFFQQHQV